MSTTLSKLLGLSSQADANLARVSQGPGKGETVRPRDCHLSNAALESLGVDCSATDFEAWWKGELEQRKRGEQTD